ncbi:MAG: penicillin-binding protein [Bdellovibrionales bacterium]|nr:penicillin-binding protein [Bdellovibrionales bacterium]
MRSPNHNGRAEMRSNKEHAQGLIKTRLLLFLVSFCLIGVAAFGTWYWLYTRGPEKSILSKTEVAAALKSSGVFQEFPTEVEMMVEGKPEKVHLDYSFDERLQGEMESLIQMYRPDYGAFVAVDANTGRILSMVSYSHHADLDDHLALRATFPAASVFKVVTAAAAIAEGNMNANTSMQFNGRNHTLYKSAVLKTKINRWTRTITLKEAFSRSVNTVFAKLGIFNVGSEDLRDYASRFGFNRMIASDLPIQEGRAVISDNLWQLAETSSGFTKDTTMSPLQGALIAAAISNGGKMMEPFAVEKITRGTDGLKLYQAQPQLFQEVVTLPVANELKSLMRETVRRGTSSGSFRRFFRGPYALLDVGGKTGSLTGLDPKGKYDWFVGYGELGQSKIAVAALTISEKYWRVKSSYLARRSFETYFRYQLGIGPKNKKNRPGFHASHYSTSP